MLTVNLIDCPDSAPCASTGRVQLNTGLFDRYAELWLPANSKVLATAFPNAGYIFTGWAQIPGGRGLQCFNIAFELTEPGQLAPIFQNANATKVGVNIRCNPPNLRVFADRTPYTPTMNLEWGWGTVHTIGVDPVQIENGKAMFSIPGATAATPRMTLSFQPDHYSELYGELRARGLWHVCDVSGRTEAEYRRRPQFPGIRLCLEAGIDPPHRRPDDSDRRSRPQVPLRLLVQWQAGHLRLCGRPDR